MVMSSSATRTRHARRDRRKAKQSGWKRHGKAKTSVVGHGTAGAVRRFGRNVEIRASLPVNESQEPLRASLSHAMKGIAVAKEYVIELGWKPRLKLLLGGVLSVSMKRDNEAKTIELDVRVEWRGK